MSFRHSLLLVFLLGVSVNAAAKTGTCQPKISAKNTARAALCACIGTWTKDVYPTKPSPSNNCSSQLASYVKASQDLKACLAPIKKR